MTYKNPIIPGFYPDPSICKANGKYYLVTSTFQYFPGVPVFESGDLLNWECIGHCLTRESQLPLRGAYSSGGIFAPTIRYHEGRFYMVTTNVTGGGNFYVYTDDIRGEWSEPIWVRREGIDPSLYFEDGRCYFMSNAEYKGMSAVTQCEIDIETGEVLNEAVPLWYGTGGRYLESPHLYKIGGYYYLMAAEGGTEYGHMITYARSNKVYGPFEPYQNNPVLTNRNLGGYSIQGVGHGDLIEDYAGNHWIVHLGFRQIDRWQPFHHLGRETFLMPVTFGEDGWFTVGNGTADEIVETPLINATQRRPVNKHFYHLRAHNKSDYDFCERKIIIRSNNDTLDDAGSPAFAAVRQEEFFMTLTAGVQHEGAGESGVTVYMDENHRYDLAVTEKYAVLRLCVGNIRHEAARIPVSGECALKVISNPLSYEFYCNEQLLGEAATRYLSSEVALGFTGVMLGLYTQFTGSGRFTGFNIDYTGGKV